MTLVYRASKFDMKRPQVSPGPGDYLDQNKKMKQSNKKQSQNSIFASKIDRNVALLINSNTTQEIGPGKYSIQNYQKSQNKTIDCKSAFNSKQVRNPFKIIEQNTVKKNSSDKNNFQKQVNFLMIKEKSQIGENKGKIMKKKNQKDFEQTLDLQKLPSIPSNQNSYGYHIDQKTKKFVNNQNPRIMFFKNQLCPNQSLPQKQIEIKKIKQTTSAFLSKNHQSQQLSHQLEYPNLTLYKVEDYKSISYQVKQKKKMAKMTVSKEKLNHINENSSKKQALILNKMRRDFGKYINQQNINLSTLISSPEKINKNDKIEVQNSFQIQHKWGKQSRFKQKNTLKNNLVVNNGIQKKQKKQQKESNQELSLKKQPFSVGQRRFKSTFKQKLGPGCYNTEIQKEITSGLNKRTEQRFKAQKISEEPGPGTYNQLLNMQNGSSPAKIGKALYKQNYHVAKKQLKNRYQQPKNTQNMKNLFRLSQKQPNFTNLNYLNKSSKKNDSRDNSILEAKKVLKQKLRIEQKTFERYDQQSKSLFSQSMKNHLYTYQKPQPKQINIGPGSFQVSKDLVKKSHNITYD